MEIASLFSVYGSNDMIPLVLHKTVDKKKVDKTEQ